MGNDRPQDVSLSLLDLLIRLGYEELQDLARRFGLLGVSPSRRSLSSQVLAQYRDERVIGDIVRSLPQSESDLLGLLILIQDLQRQEDSRSPRAGLIESSTQLSTALKALIESGLVFRGPDEPSQWIVPSEIVPAVREALRSEEIPSPVIKEEPLWGGTERILWMLFRFLAAIHMGRLHQTQNDMLAKKDLELWFSSLPSDSFPPPPFPHLVSVEDAAGFLLAAGRQLDLIADQDGDLITTEHSTTWLQQNRRVLLRDLWIVFLECIAIKRPEWRRLLFCLVHENCDSQPLWHVTLSGASALRGSLTVWFSWFGLVKVVRSKQGLTAVRTAQPGPWESFEAPMAESRCRDSTLQPNFELMVPPDTPLDTLWRVEQFANHHHTDVVSIYQLSRQSIIRGLRSGLSSSEIRDELAALTGGRIPQNIRFSLEEWFDSFGRVEVEEIVLVRCRTPEVAEEIQHIPEAEKAIRERLGPTLLVADPSRVQSLLDTLERIGFAPIVRESPRRN
ncbi:MAG: helicase-associated domain-containing protein [bacterium]